MNNTILSTDLLHCRLDLATQIVKDYEEDAWIYLNENKAVYDDFCNMQIDSDCSIEEYIYYYQWSEFINYLRNKYDNHN